MKRIRRAIHKPYRLKPHESVFKKPVFWCSVIFLVLAGAAIYFLFFWQGLQIKNIIITGNQEVQANELQQLISSGVDKKILFFDSKSIFLFNPGKINKLILDSYPKIDSVNTQKKLPQTITVEIKERKPFATICAYTGFCFYMDLRGVAYDRLMTLDPSLPTIQQHVWGDAVLGSKVLDERTVSAISEIKNNFQQNFSPLDITKADIVSADRMDITTTEGWQVYFNLSTDINLQITKLNLLLQKTFPKSENRAKLQYIDLRFENRAYYK